MIAKTEILTRVGDLVQSTRLGDDQRERALSAARRVLSRLTPYDKAEDLKSTGARLQPLPADWAIGISWPQAIWYPIEPPNPLGRYTWATMISPEGLRLAFATPPPKDALYRFFYSAVWPEVKGPDGETVYIAVDEGCRGPLEYLAAAEGLRILANSYAATSDPVLQADVVDYRSRSDQYASRAKEMLALVRHHPGALYGDWDPEPAWHPPMGGWLTHRGDNHG